MLLKTLSGLMGRLDLRSGKVTANAKLRSQLEAKGITAVPDTVNKLYDTLVRNGMKNYLPLKSNGDPYALNTLNKSYTRNQLFAYANKYANLYSLKLYSSKPVSVFFETAFILEHACSFLNLRQGFSIAPTGRMIADQIAAQSTLVCRVKFLEERGVPEIQLKDLFKREYTNGYFKGYYARHFDSHDLLTLPFTSRSRKRRTHGNVIMRVRENQAVEIFSMTSVHITEVNQEKITWAAEKATEIIKASFWKTLHNQNLHLSLPRWSEIRPRNWVITDEVPMDTDDDESDFDEWQRTILETGWKREPI